MRVSATASANLSGPPSGKPPVIAHTIGLASTIIRTVKTSTTGKSSASTSSAKTSAPWRPPPWRPTSRLNIGTKAAAKAPSAKSARNRLGSRQAIRKASLARPAPTYCAISMSRTKPAMRLTRVRPPIVAVLRTRLMTKTNPS